MDLKQVFLAFPRYFQVSRPPWASKTIFLIGARGGLPVSWSQNVPRQQVLGMGPGTSKVAWEV